MDRLACRGGRRAGGDERAPSDDEQPQNRMNKIEINSDRLRFRGFWQSPCHKTITPLQNQKQNQA